MAGGNELVNFEYLTERVKEIAVKADLEHLTKSALTVLREGLIEVFHDIIVDLV